jgi:sec-independent protein translocase protein TatB
MFDIGFPELILIAIVGLLVIGPERLPEALRTLGLWIGRMRRSFTNVKTEIEKEIGMDEIRRQLHNEAVMEEMKRIERDVRDSVRAGENSTRHSDQARRNDGEPQHGAGAEEAPPGLEPAAGSRGAPQAGEPAARHRSAQPDAASAETDGGERPDTSASEPPERARDTDDARRG